MYIEDLVKIYKKDIEKAILALETSVPVGDNIHYRCVYMWDDDLSEFKDFIKKMIEEASKDDF